MKRLSSSPPTLRMTFMLRYTTLPVEASRQAVTAVCCTLEHSLASFSTVSIVLLQSKSLWLVAVNTHM